MTFLRRSLLLFGLALLAACGAEEEAGAIAKGAMPMIARDEAMMSAPAGEQAASAAQVQYLAERQYWRLELPETQVEARWQAHLDLCRAGCEVLNAAISKSTQVPVSASLQLRVARAQAPALLKAMSSAEVKERRIEREDKTLQVVDVEARLKNMAELRDRLRHLLDGRPGALKDVLETERELARVQGELDAMTAQRKTLANETEKILVNVEYQTEPSLGGTGAMQPLFDAFSSAGHELAASLAEALLFVIRILPWLFIVLPAVWGGWKLVKRLFAWKRGS